jgi:hypothetical protein
MMERRLTAVCIAGSLGVSGYRNIPEMPGATPGNPLQSMFIHIENERVD